MLLVIFETSVHIGNGRYAERICVTDITIDVRFIVILHPVVLRLRFAKLMPEEISGWECPVCALVAQERCGGNALELLSLIDLGKSTDICPVVHDLGEVRNS